jgi:hypothetical protein
MICLQIEHVFSYVCSFYRHFDISENGKFDINGIKRAVNESKLANLQFILQCLIIGYGINHFVTGDAESFHADSNSV